MIARIGSMAVLAACLTGARGARAAGPVDQGVSLDQVLAGLRVKRPLQPLVDKLSLKQQANAAGSLQTTSAWFLGAGSEVGIRGDESERRVEIALGRRQTFGVDPALVHHRAAQDADAAKLEATIKMREQELEVAKLYVECRFYQGIAIHGRESLAAVEPMLTRGKAAAARGSIGFLSVRRWELLVQKIAVRMAQAEAAFGVHAKTLSAITGVQIASAPAVRSLAPVPTHESAWRFDPAAFLPSRASRARQEALAAATALTRHAWEIEARVGGYTDLDAKRSGILLGVEMPIGYGLIAASRAREIAVERDILSAELHLAEIDAARRFAILQGAADSTRLSRELADRRVQDLDRLVEDARRATLNAQADVAELIEALKDLYEARIERAEAIREHEKATLDLDYILYKEEEARR